MDDDLVVQKILKLLENNTAFIGYALNGGIGTKINVRNTETGKTIQALSINVDSTGEVLVVKDSEDNQYKAVTFKTAEKVSEKIIQLRKTKPVDDKKTLEYTDSDIEVFYLFVKLIDTGSPVPTQLTSTWIRKGSSCTQFVGAYERCNYASKDTIGGVSYTGLPYKPYETLQACLNDDTGRDAKTPHGSKDENGLGLGVRIYSTKMTALAEQNLKGALESHDATLGTNYKKLFGYGSILECSGGMYVQGWELAKTQEDVPYIHCDFGYFPGFATDCTPTMQQAGYCTANGAYISSKAPPPGDPRVGGLNNSWAYQYGWIDLPYEFMYRRHFIPLYVNGAPAQGSFLIITGLNEDQQPTIPEGYFPWKPGCPSGGDGGPYDGSGGNRFPDGVAPPQKRDMKLSTHKAEIWLGSSKKTEAIKLYELGASDLFSGMYNAFIIKANETRKDIEDRLNRGFSITEEEITQHNIFYQNWNKNRIDLNIDPRVWVYIVNNVPKAVDLYTDDQDVNPSNGSLHNSIHNLYNRTINLSIIDKKTQVIHLKLGLTPRSIVSNTDCKGSNTGYRDTDKVRSSQSWEYQQYRTITVQDWKVTSTTNILDLTKLDPEYTWNLDYIKRKFYTSFGDLETRLNYRDTYDQILLRHDASIDKEKIITDIHYEQFNYSLKFIVSGQNFYGGNLWLSGLRFVPYKEFYDNSRYYGLSTKSWWDLWGKGIYNKKDKRLCSIVGYEKNLHQIARSYGTGLNLNYDGNAIGGILSNESYFEYLNQDRPQVFIPSIIKTLRTDKTATYYNDLDDRQKTLNELGTLFFFSEIHSRWTEPGFKNTSTDISFVSLPSLYYGFGGYGRETLSSHNALQSNLQNKNTLLKIMDTRSWLQNLWAQLIYDGFINVDVDSYKDVDFTLPSDPEKYKKFSLFKEGTNTEYPFSTIIHHTDPPVELDTVLSAGKLEIANKQVKITKPTNVDLDPNYSFLVYLYPFVEVTKKKKTI